MVTATVERVTTPDPARPPDDAARRSRRRQRTKTALWCYLAILPALLVIGVFSYYPAGTAMTFSFTDWRPGFDSPFVGLENYRAMLVDRVWWDSFKNLGYIFLFGVGTWIFPFVAAELLISLRSKNARFIFRSLLIAPIAFPSIVTMLVWGFMYEPTDGVINTMFRAIGLDFLAHNWLGDPRTALLALMFIGFPFIAGLPFLIFLNGLQNIPTDVFDAAAIDGAGRIRRAIRIDVPLLADQLGLLGFLAVIATLQAGMASYALTGGGPDNATQTPILRILAAAFNASDWGYAAALSNTLFLLTAVFCVVAFVLRKRWMRRAG